MKKHTILKRMPTVVFTSLLFIFVFSCKKTEYIQTFDDVFDTSGVSELNMKIANTTSLDELMETFSNVKLVIPENLEKLSLDDMIQHYTSSIELSSEEIDLLLKNDSKTYLDVVNRFGSLPGDINEINFTELKASLLNRYLVRQKAETVNFYSNDYYSAILAYRNFIESEVIQPMENLKKAAKTIPPGNPNKGPAEDATLLYLKLITSNNNWDMWWAYWSDGTRTKHKGAAGSYPGN